MNRKILVVDDNRTNVELLTARLVMEGYEVFSAADGVEGLKATLAVAPDLILLDIMMPRMDGFELCKILKSREDTRLIPVVIITALDELDDKLMGLDLGAEDYITKPFSLLEVSARVGSILKMRAIQSRLVEAEKKAALGEVALGIAHELRNPLVTIGGLARRIAEKEKGGDLEEHAVAIIEGVERLERMVERVDEYEGALSSILVPGHIEGVVKAAVKEASERSARRDDSPVVEYMDAAPAVLPIVLMDETNLQRAVLNVILNALDASGGASGSTVSVGVREGVEGDRMGVVVIVEDKGRGMDEEERRGAPLPFHTSMMSGAGLGLTITDRVVGDHGGEMRIESEQGVGTTVTIWLPAIE